MLQFVSNLDMLKTLCGHKWHSENFDDKQKAKKNMNKVWTWYEHVFPL